MNAQQLNQIVEAVLYEGYILYPYRASSKKNRQRFTFGRVYPHDYHVAQDGAEAWTLQTQCLLRKNSDATSFDVSAGFLQPTMREIRKPVDSMDEVSAAMSGSSEAGPLHDTPGHPQLELVPELLVDGQLYQTWQECVERKITVPNLKLEGNAQSVPFSFPSSRTMEPVRDKRGRIAAVIVRRQEAIEGQIEISTEAVDADVSKILVRLMNCTPIPAQAIDREEEVLMRTLASAHTILQTRGGEFISLTDPSAEYVTAAASCQNIGCWPVLVGDENKAERDTLLASPIILPDYPKIAGESQGTLFDGLEIDEILTLRIMTMTDAEKHEMRTVDQHARALLERTESLSSDHLMKMHGTLRGLQPVEDNAMQDPFDADIFGNSRKIEGATVKGRHLRTGDLVRIRPKSRADAMDMMLAGKVALIEAVEQDAEGKVHFALVLEDDPGRDLGMMRQPGHRFFYGQDEVEPMSLEDPV